jgi:hypothetical protein
MRRSRAVEPEFQHGRMSGYDAFGQCLLKHADRIALVQGPEGWGDFEWAWAHLVNRVTLRAIGEREALALFSVGCQARSAAGSSNEKAKSNADGVLPAEHVHLPRKGTFPGSVRHQDRHCHASEHVAGDAAEDEFL